MAAAETHSHVAFMAIPPICFNFLFPMFPGHTPDPEPKTKRSWIESRLW